MSSTEKGYVYILTNPSFREDWVKIGKSSRPVNVRSKELDNTAVPLPFEIFATMETKKYHEVEKLVHKTIDRLTDLRIRQNREFFNVAPKVALDILRDIASTIDDAVIIEYRDNKPLSNAIPTEKSCSKLIHTKPALSPSRLFQLKFWESFRDAAQKDALFTEAFTLPKPLPRGYYGLALGNRFFCISISASVKKQTIACELYMKSQKDFYHHLHSENDLLTEEIGEKLYWEEAKKDSRMVARREADITQSERWGEYFTWMRKTTLRIRAAYKRRIV